jgi:hypothetical protein
MLLQKGPSGAFRETPGVLRTYEDTAHGGPSARRTSAQRALGRPRAVFLYV